MHIRNAVAAFAALLGAIASGSASAEEAPGAFLDRLVGCWILDGQMGDIALHQQVDARRVLGGHFVEMRFAQTDAPAAGRARYEAIYLIGYDAEARRYVLNLFDSLGVTSAPAPGVGERSGDTIRFEFPYREGAFYNTFSLADGQWNMRLEQRQPDGSLRLFAEKHMRHC